MTCFPHTSYAAVVWQQKSHTSAWISLSVKPQWNIELNKDISLPDQLWFLCGAAAQLL